MQGLHIAQKKRSKRPESVPHHCHFPTFTALELTMLTAQRQQLLLARLAADHQIIAKDLAHELGLSEDTLRRDLRALAAQGRLRRVHGGALPLAAAEGNMRVRSQLSIDEKVALGQAGARLIQRGQLVLLDGGTTALQVARHLAPDLRATIVTHSPTIAVELAAHPWIDIQMLGGRLFRHSMVNLGAAVLDAVSQLRADLYFMGASGVHPALGLSTGDPEEAAVKRALHARAADTIVLASSEKLLAASPYVIAPMSAISTLLVPAHTPAKTLAAFRKSSGQGVSKAKGQTDVRKV